MNPDSDSEVKLKWANGEVSGYVKIHRLTMVAGGKHASHPHNVAPSSLSTGWVCDVCRRRCAQLHFRIDVSVNMLMIQLITCSHFGAAIQAGVVSAAAAAATTTCVNRASARLMPAQAR